MVEGGALSISWRFFTLLLAAVFYINFSVGWMWVSSEWIMNLLGNLNSTPTKWIHLMPQQIPTKLWIIEIPDHHLKGQNRFLFPMTLAGETVASAIVYRSLMP